MRQLVLRLSLVSCTSWWLLQIEAWNRNEFSRDELIGTTTIGMCRLLLLIVLRVMLCVWEGADLEDRWYDRRWAPLGRVADGPPLRPVENRSLWSPLFASPQACSECCRCTFAHAMHGSVKKSCWSSFFPLQGSLDMWLDIFTHAEALTCPPIDIRPPPPEDFEVRLIIWQTKEVQFRGKILKTADLFVRAWVEGTAAQKSDVHLR